MVKYCNCGYNKFHLWFPDKNKINLRCDRCGAEIHCEAESLIVKELPPPKVYTLEDVVEMEKKIDGTSKRST